MNTYLRSVCVFVLLVIPVSLHAHHSQALARYDADHPATLNGTVVEVRLINLHSVLVFDVTDARGQAGRWRAELPAAVALHKAGWTRRSRSQRAIGERQTFLKSSRQSFRPLPIAIPFWELTGIAIGAGKLLHRPHRTAMG